MTRQSMASRNPDIVSSAKALRRAARRALELGLSTGTPVYVIKDGEIVDLTREMAATGRKLTAVVRETHGTYRTAGVARSPTDEGREHGRKRKQG